MRAMPNSAGVVLLAILVAPFLLAAASIIGAGYFIWHVTRKKN